METFTEIAQQFGLNWAKFFAQIIIFGVVFTVLRAKAFGPIMGMLEQRRQRIADGEAALAKIKEDQEQAEAKAQAKIDEANVEADRLIEEARESGDALREKKTQEATLEAGNIIAKAKEASQLEREQALSMLKKDFGRLVVDTTSKVTGKVLNKDDQDKINQETAGQIAL
tara:strand:- start:8862 stop:9371 length:510 start_codon:yes stop_codon:yes gene_type:complete